LKNWVPNLNEAKEEFFLEPKELGNQNFKGCKNWVILKTNASLPRENPKGEYPPGPQVNKGQFGKQWNQAPEELGNCWGANSSRIMEN